MRTLKIYRLGNSQICNAVLLPMIAVLYITSQDCFRFITGSLCLLTPFTCFTHPLMSSTDNHQSLLCVYDFGFFSFGFQISHVSEIMHYWYLSWYNALKVHAYCDKPQDFFLFITEYKLSTYSRQQLWQLHTELWYKTEYYLLFL